MTVDPNDDVLLDELIRDEGFVDHAYQDSLGYWTLGIGTLIDVRKGGRITLEEGKYLARNRVAEKKADLDRLAPWWRTLDPVRQRVVMNMAFNLGAGWVTSWPNTVAMIRAGRWAAAADAMLDSKWARQVGDRAKRLAQMMRTGEAV